MSDGTNGQMLRYDSNAPLRDVSAAANAAAGAGAAAAAAASRCPTQPAASSTQAAHFSQPTAAFALGPAASQSSTYAPFASQVDEDEAAGAAQRFHDLPEYVPQYHNEIVQYFLTCEVSHPRDCRYLESQPDITERMRVILVDWIVDVAIKFKLHPETFYLAVDIVDRYLAVQPVQRATLQLVGITAVLMAAKHEEIWPPEVRECVYISANTYSRDDILRTERDMAGALRFRLAVPTCYPILCQFLDTIGAELIEAHLAHYFMETASLDYQMLRFAPSRVAYASFYLARATMLHRDWVRQGVVPMVGPALAGRVWTSTEDRAAFQCELEEIVACAQQLLAFTRGIVTGNRYLAVKRKYSHTQFSDVSNAFALPEMI